MQKAADSFVALLLLVALVAAKIVAKTPVAQNLKAQAAAKFAGKEPESVFQTESYLDVFEVLLDHCAPPYYYMTQQPYGNLLEIGE